jgi:Fe-S cluster biosynthesis and repair protein YggX
MTKKQPTKTPHEILVEQLAVLSADIPAKVGKMARDNAVDQARMLINEVKSKVNDEFQAWLSQNLLKVVSKEERQLYETYITVGAQMTACLKEKHGDKAVQVTNNYLRAMPLEKFLTGEYWVGSEHDRKIEVYYQKIKGYAAKKAGFEAKINELSAMLEDVRRAVFRTYKSKTAVTAAGHDLSSAVGTLVKTALGVNLLEAPKTVDCDIVLEDVIAV